jgi:membrane protein implicated in regulation of membrane protease activity
MNPFIKGHHYMIKTITLILLALVLLTPVSTALAYVGPGAGMSVLGSLLSILATIVVAIGAIIIWPLRKFMKRRKARRNSTAGAETVNTVADSTRDGS